MSDMTTNTAFNSLADLKLWFNDSNGAPLMLSDVPEILPLRWPYFRDNWEFIADNIKTKIATYSFPDMLDTQIAEFSEFIRRQRNSQNKNINPFSSIDILNTYYTIFDSIEIASLPISKEESTLINRRLTNVRRFIKTDFQTIRSNLVKARDDIADVTGTTDIDYNRVYHRSPTRKLRDIKLRDIQNMDTFLSGITTVDYILANIGSLGTVTLDPFALARLNANNPDMDIRLNKSGTLVRMNYGDSLTDLAYRYLRDENRWLDIAIANGLKPPYVDEVGEPIFLLSNGKGNQINISGTDPQGNSNIDKLYINQVIFLQSDISKFPDQRIIQNIRHIPVSGEIVIELTGDANLSTYQLIDNAYMRVFKPNTVNSSFFVLIPSEEPTDTTPINGIPYFLATKGEDEKRAGVDLAVGSNMDLVFGSNGDLQLSFGVANAVQAIQFKMMSEQGQNPKHPTYGLAPVVGSKMNDPEAVRQVLIDSVNSMIEADLRFDRVEQLNARLNGNVFIISLVVRMAGSGSLIPISFNVNVG